MENPIKNFAKSTHSLEFYGWSPFVIFRFWCGCMKKILLILVCLWAIPAAASHIVGGEFEIAHVGDNRYRINLVLYFDELNGSIGARDGSVQARIFRKRDDALMMDVYLPFANQAPVSYTQPSCSNGEIVTTRIVYSSIVTLSPQQFSDAKGYYLAWER